MTSPLTGSRDPHLSSALLNRAKTMGSSNHETHRSAVPHRQRHRPLLRRHLRSSGGTRYEVGRSGLRSRLRRQPGALVASPPPSLLVEPSPPSLPLSSLRLSPPDANLVQCLAHCTFFVRRSHHGRGKETSMRRPGALSASSTAAPCNSAMAATRLRPSPLPDVERSCSRR